MDVLRRKGIDCDICTPDTAKNYKIVLVSLTSEYDCFALYKSVALLPSWQPGRKFVVVAGGAGFQNPTVIRNYIDYGVFGRGENIIYPLIDCVMGGNVFTHESVMNLPDIHPVKLAQVSKLYPYDLEFGSGKTYRKWEESFIGCPNKCLFCHYSWARKKIGENTYESPYKIATEKLWKDIFEIKEKKGQLKTAIDGFSERLRFTYGKKISNKEIIEGIEYLGSLGGNPFMIVYNINNMPYENKKDMEEFYSTVQKANPKNKIVFILQSTPFRPSLLTPLQYAPVALFPVIRGLPRVIYKSNTLMVLHAMTNEGPYSQLEIAIILRATFQTDKLFHTICFHPKLKKGTARQKVRLLQKSFDLSPYLCEYSADKKHPAWFLSSYTENKKLYKIYEIAKKRLSNYGKR